MEYTRKMKDYINKVFRNFFEHDYPKETEQNVQQWIVDEQHAEEKEAFLYNYWKELRPETKKTVYVSLEAVRKKAGIEEQDRTILMRRRFLRVAAVLIPLLLLAGAYLYYDDPFVDSSLLRVEATYGDRKELVLPDGTKVWINAGTTLQYPATFSEDSRTVRLSGEAYFDVQRDESRPFIVETRKLSVRVLGTRFNVSAYPDDGQIVTTLNSGQVAIETGREDAILLEPDQQLSFDKKTNEVSLQQVESSAYSAWRSGDILLENVTIIEMIRTLERRFDVVIKPDKGLQERTDRFTAKFVSGESIDKILDVISKIAHITYEHKGDKVWLTQQ